MKSRPYIFLSILVSVLLSSGLWAQYANWTQYTNGRHITSTAMEGGSIWVGTTGGMVRVDTLTLDTQFFNTANSGLPSNDISAIAVDNQGNKWIGTKGKGLVRFTGSSYSYYRQEVLGSDIVNAVAFDTDTLWVGTNGGAAKFDGTGWTIFNRPNFLPSDTVTSIAFGFGVGWFGTAKGILKYEIGQFSNQNMNLPEQYITSVSVWPDASRFPWVGLQNNGVAQMSGTSWNLHNTTSGLPSNLIQSVAVDVNGRVLAGTPSGLGFYDGNTWKTYNTGNSLIPDDDVTTVQWWNISNKANIGTFGGGLATLSFADTSWTGIPTSNSGLTTDRVHAVSVTQDGRIRAGSTGYLAYFDGNTWTTYTPADLGILQGGFSAMALDVSGNPWVGTEGQGLLYYNGNQWTTYSAPSTAGFPENTIRAIAVAPNGDVWIGTYGGVGRFNGTAWTTYNTTSNPRIFDNVVRAMAIGTDGSVWISDGASSGPVKFNGTTWTVQDGSSINLMPGLSWVSYVNSAGEPWLGTPNSGAALYSGGQWFQFNSTNTNISSDNVRSITPDKNGYLWFGTANGLVRFDRPNMIFRNTFKTDQTAPSGLTSSSVNAVAVGPNNEIYAATDSGLAVYSGFPIQLQPNLLLRSNTFQFGSVVLSQTSTLSIWMKNTGSANLVVDSLNFIQIVQGSYSITNPALPATIAPNDSVRLSVRFSPTQAQLYPGNLRIVSNSPSSPDNVSLAGTGVVTGFANLQLRPASLAFGIVLIGNADTLAVVSKNTGTANLIINLVQYPAGFSYIGNLTYPDTLAPGDSVQGSIRFAPTQAKAYRDTIKVFTNAPTSRYDYIVTGTGVPPGLNEPYLMIRNRMFGYDTIKVGNSSTISTYFKNTGTATLVIDSLKFIEVLPGVYTLLSTQPPINILAGDSTQVSIRLTPTDVVFYGGQVKVVSNSPTSPDTLYIGGAGYASQMTFTDETIPVHTGLYGMFTIPYVIQDNSILSVLSSLGPYGSKTWRLFHWKNGRYLEYPEFTPTDSLNFKPGIAYWLVARDPLVLDLKNIQNTPVLLYNGPFASVLNYRITLRPGWNMIGNPFAYPVQWNQVLNTASIQNPVVFNVRWKEYDLDPYDYTPTTLEPWRGYFVYNRTPNLIVIQVPPFSTIPKTSRPTTLANDEFVLQIQAKAMASKLRSSRVCVGLLNAAEDGLDNEDYFEAPPIGDCLQMSIVDGKNLYAGNFKKISSAGAAWDFSLSTTGEKEKVEINLDGPATLPKGFKVFLLDRDRECTIPIQNGKADIDIEGIGKARQLRMIVGTEEYARQESQNIPLVPYKFALKQNYPNPFNPETHIVYSLSQKSLVKLTIYNTLGQKVRTLFQGEQGAGAYPTTWNGTDDRGLIVNSGVYVCRLEAGQFAISKKMILIR